ncbi:MAG TPA: flagellar FlbD family protein [Atopostipes sp.]|nr:flagellar FlbD family protein [Atopostipes sp.]
MTIHSSLPHITMIELTRLNGETFILNATMIEQIQSYPDTTITLVNGKKLVVKNSEAEVVSLATQFYQKTGIIGNLCKAGE